MRGPEQVLDSARYDENDEEGKKGKNEGGKGAERVDGQRERNGEQQSRAPSLRAVKKDTIAERLTMVLMG
jgi:hypothetical protein